MIHLKSKSTGHIVTVPAFQVLGLDLWEDVAAPTAAKSGEKWKAGNLTLHYLDPSSQVVKIDLKFPSMTAALGERDRICAALLSGAAVELEVA
jgi:hypothetical protein